MRSRWHLRVNALVLGWLVAAALVAVVHSGVPEARWLVVHALLLGAVSTAILIWSAHFAEAVRRRALRGGHRDQAVRLVTHTVGATTTVLGTVVGSLAVVVAGAVLVGLVAVWHGVVLWDQSRRALTSMLGWTTWFFVVAAASLPVGIALGVLLGRASGTAHSRLYVAHVASMVLGWVGLTVVGTLVTLWPTMLRVRMQPGGARPARQGFVALVLGLVLVVTGAVVGLRWLAAVGLGVYLAGLVRSAVPLVDEARRRRPGSFATRSVAAASLWWCGSVLAWLVVLVFAAGWPEVEVRVGGLLAPVVVGFALQVLLGASSYLVPMILGGGPAVVRATNAVADSWGTMRLVLVNGGLALSLLPGPRLLVVAASAVVVAALVWTPVLLVRVAVLARRARPQPTASVVTTSSLPGPVGAARVPPRLMGQRGQALAAGAVLTLVVVVGIAADPERLGAGAAGAGVPPTGAVIEVAVELRDMRFEPSSVDVRAGAELVLVVTNTDDSVHDLVLETGASSGRLAPQESARVEVGVVGDDLSGWCSVAGHRQMGMVFDVRVVGADSSGGATGGAQTLGLQPAQGGFVELVPAEAGHYPFISHRMVDAERGAHGILEVAG